MTKKLKDDGAKYTSQFALCHFYSVRNLLPANNGFSYLLRLIFTSGCLLLLASLRCFSSGAD